MDRIFFFSGYRLQAIHFIQNQFVGRISFNGDKQGQQEFDEYLQKTPKTPVKLLVDIIEESYKLEAIPKVFGGNRKLLINNVVKKNFKEYPLKSFVSYGKDKLSLNKEIILCYAITETNILSPWLSILEKNKTPLMGIWSIPLLAHNVYRFLKKSHKNLLLVTQQVPSCIRQFYFKDGILNFSRQLRVDSVADKESNKFSFSILLSTTAEQTKKFLNSSNTLKHDEELLVLAITPDKIVNEIKNSLVNIQNIFYDIKSISEVSNKVISNNHSWDYMDGFFAKLCLQQSTHTKHYRIHQSNQFYRKHTQRKVIYTFNFIFILSLIGLIPILITDSINDINKTKLIKQEIYNQKQLYANTFENHVEKLNDAFFMQSTVELFNQLDKENSNSPLSFLLDLSASLTQERFDFIELMKINWTNLKFSNKSSNDEDESILTDNYDYDEDLQNDNLNRSNKDVIEVIIEGKINIKSNDYRANIITINALVSELENIPYVTRVNLIQLPVDLRSTETYSNKSVTHNNKESGTSDSEPNNFIIKISMQSNINALIQSDLDHEAGINM